MTAFMTAKEITPTTTITIKFLEIMALKMVGPLAKKLGQSTAGKCPKC